jgi:CRP/FNR family transcriptional regulator, cyclic AMP receptor protein
MAPRGLQALAEVPLFAHLSGRDLRRVHAVTEEYTYPEGTVIAREGSSGDAFFVILEGQADVKRGGRRVATMWPGDFFGEISLLDGGPRTATVSAQTSIRCLVLLHEEFLRLLASDGAFAAKILRGAARRLRQMDHPLRG